MLHYPVLNKKGERICSTVDSFDFFDAARLAQTFGLARLYFVNPQAAQQALIARLIDHGSNQAREHSERGHFTRSVGVEKLDAAIQDAQKQCGSRPRIIATTAGAGPDATPVRQLRMRLWDQKEPQLWLIGKAWGLAPEVLEGADEIAEAIDAGTGYNHLSVRSALAIYVDRLLAPRRE